MLFQQSPGKLFISVGLLTIGHIYCAQALLSHKVHFFGLEEVWYGTVQLLSHEYQQCDMWTVRLTEGVSVSQTEHSGANPAGNLRNT